MSHKTEDFVSDEELQNIALSMWCFRFHELERRIADGSDKGGEEIRRLAAELGEGPHSDRMMAMVKTALTYSVRQMNGEYTWMEALLKLIGHDDHALLSWNVSRQDAEHQPQTGSLFSEPIPHEQWHRKVTSLFSQHIDKSVQGFVLRVSEALADTPEDEIQALRRELFGMIRKAARVLAIELPSDPKLGNMMLGILIGYDPDGGTRKRRRQPEKVM